MYPFAFAPYGLWPLAIASIVILILCVDRSSKRGSRFPSLNYLAFGLGKFGVGTSWIYESLVQFGDASAVLATSLVATFVVFYAVMFFLVFVLASSLVRAYAPFRWLRQPTVIFIFGWLCFELLHHIVALDISFPWLQIGYAFTDTWLAGLAAVGGVNLVGIAVLIVSIGIFMIPTLRHWSLFLIGVPWIAGWLAHDHEWTRQVGELNVAIVQANMSLNEKWDEGGLEDSWNLHLSLTQSVPDADLIIWPEGSIPGYEARVVDRFRQLAIEQDAEILAGLFHRVWNIDREKRETYNSALHVSPDSERRPQRYLKMKLVPFGEYVPFQSVLRPIGESLDLPMAQLKSGPKGQAPIQTRHGSIAIGICYEIAYPALMMEHAEEAHFLVTLSEDAWFGNTMGPAQHMQIARMRAVETGRFLLRSTSRGITAIANSKGEMVETLPQFEAGVLSGTVPTMQGSTAYMWVFNLIGFWPNVSIWVLLAFLFQFTASAFTKSSIFRSKRDRAVDDANEKEEHASKA